MSSNTRQLSNTTTRLCLVLPIVIVPTRSPRPPSLLLILLLFTLVPLPITSPPPCPADEAQLGTAVRQQHRFCQCRPTSAATDDDIFPSGRFSSSLSRIPSSCPGHRLVKPATQFAPGTQSNTGDGKPEDKKASLPRLLLPPALSLAGA